MPEIDLNDVSLFVRVLDEGSFAKVARAAKVPTSTVSRAVARLEGAVGVPLLHRTTRAVQPTTEGRAFYASVSPALATVRGAARDLEGAGSSPSGHLRVTASGDVGTTLLPAMVVAFAEKCPNVSIEIDLSARRVNLVEEGFDLALRAGPLTDSSLVAKKLAESDLALYASATYVQKRGLPESVAALEKHRVVLFRPREGSNEWALTGAGGETVKVTVRGALAGQDYAFVRAAVAAGGGIALLPQVIAAAPGSADPLVRVLPAYRVGGGALYVVHPSAKKVPLKVAAFRDFLVEAFAKLAP
ncbi:MAG TPA: LysR family transcriptional regulator [Polyangiaceae bacterium]|jgi:DNA-binding transcriptional LysR family regulator